MKKLTLRSCIGCRVKKVKAELIRIVKNQNGKISVDTVGKMSGRGAYICGDEACFQKIVKTKQLERVLETKIESEIYENLRGVISDKSK